MSQDERVIALQKFVDGVVKQARTNLTKRKKNASKKLYNSIKGESKVYPNSIRIGFQMEDYGFFQDQGVRGKDPSKVSKNAKIKGQQAPNSRFKFGSGNYAGSWQSFVTNIEVWAKRKNIRLRDEEGKYKKGNYRTIAQIIAGNIFDFKLNSTGQEYTIDLENLTQKNKVSGHVRKITIKV
jgi:hypothetical protein